MYIALKWFLFTPIRGVAIVSETRCIMGIIIIKKFKKRKNEDKINRGRNRPVRVTIFGQSIYTCFISYQSVTRSVCV